MFRGLLVVLLLAISLHAQEKPDAPKPKTDSVFWIGTAALAAAKTFDATGTRSLLNTRMVAGRTSQSLVQNRHTETR